MIFYKPFSVKNDQLIWFELPSAIEMTFWNTKMVIFIQNVILLTIFGKNGDFGNRCISKYELDLGFDSDSWGKAILRCENGYFYSKNGIFIILIVFL